MGTPRQVDEAAQMAEELHAQMFADEEQGQEQEEKQEEQEEQGAVQDETPQIDEEEEKFQARYKALKGKYDAEVPRLHHELKELKQMVFERIGDITKKVEKPEPEPLDPVIEKFKEEYGEEYLNYLDKFTEAKARRLIKEALAEQIAPVQQQVQSVEETQIKVAQDNFVSYLDQHEKLKDVNWRKLWSGEDEKFVEFLGNVEPNSGFRYADIVKFHNDNWNADGLASVFEAYARSQAPVQQTQQVEKKPNPAKDAMVAPSRATNNTAPKIEDKKIWTQDMIAEFQKADRAGRYDADTSKAMWEDLLKALGENRIR